MSAQPCGCDPDVACLKQTTSCVIIRAHGRRYEATNTCRVSGQTICPRVTALCGTAVGYVLCGRVHAEANAAALAAESADVAGEAFLSGHDYICPGCQHALAAVNVRTFHLVDEAHGYGTRSLSQVELKYLP